MHAPSVAPSTAEPSAGALAPPFASSKPAAVKRKTMRRRAISTNMGGRTALPLYRPARGPPEIPEAGAPGLRQGFVEALLGFLFRDVDREGELGHEDLACLGEHALLTRRQALVLLADRQVPHHLGHLVDVARLQLLDVVLESPGPVRRHASFLLAQHREDLFDLLVVDDFAQADLLGVVGRDHQREVTVRKAEDEILTVRPEDVALLPALDDGSAVMRVDDFVSDVKRHSSPKGGTAVGTSPECHRIAGWANLTARSGGGERDARMVDMSMLSATRLFQGLPPEAVAAVAAGSSVRRLRRHDVVFEEGDLASELFRVQEGRIAIAN